MNVALRPEMERFIDEQVKMGRYASPDEVLREALARMMADEIPLDPATLDAIDESEDQIARGEYENWDDVSAELRAKYLPGK